MSRRTVGGTGRTKLFFYCPRETQPQLEGREVLGKRQPKSKKATALPRVGFTQELLPAYFKEAGVGGYKSEGKESG